MHKKIPVRSDAQIQQGQFVRNFVFGVEDSLVSTVGLLSGIAVAGVDRGTILTTGFVLILVEAFSMGAGAWLSEHSVQEFEEHKEVPFFRAARSSIVMFFSYVSAGLIPLLPYVCTDGAAAFRWSIGLTLLSLCLLGVFNAKTFRIRTFHEAFMTLLIGGAAVIVGVAVGGLVNKLI